MNILKKLIKSLLFKKGYIIKKNSGELPKNDINILKLLVEQVPVDSKNFVIIQIGAYDGISNDPVYPLIIERGYFGILVEPMPRNFEKLCETYQDIPNVKLENIAIGKMDGFSIMYYVEDNQSLPESVNQLASFDKNNVLKNLKFSPNINKKEAELEKCINTINIPTNTISSLVNKYEIQHINLLQIDTEGFDYEILKMIFEANLEPDIINFESCHLSINDKLECGDLLISHGYQYLQIGRDTIAASILLLNNSQN